ncbi:MAG TPA: M6 family metalloprotease domain-containing protein [Candidatus Aminicenantes bacterium]|nr:M6 family metalloprotease domain-containing protein [Candidatus Aminicenantes bacterium]
MNKSIIFKPIKRILIITVLFIILSAHLQFSPLFGHPVWGEKTILTQLNGTRIVGYIYGDEFHRRIETREGYTMILNEEAGTIEYALLVNNKLVPSGMVVGVVSTSYLEMINFPKHLSDRKFKIAEIRRKSPERLHELEPRSQEEIKMLSLTGTKKVFVVCVDFQSEASPPTEWSAGEFSPSGFNTRLFSTGASDISMTNYYKANSYNTFWPDGYTYPTWITLPQTASWYKDNDSWRKIIIDAMDGIRTINSSFDFTQYATSGDMDMILVWAGRRMNWSEFYWPHRSTAYVNKYGVRVKNYNAVNEKNSDGSENTAIDVFCHEYGHMTGSPDLYDYSSFQLTPIGYYCVMGTSNYKTNFCGYLKWRIYGWVTPEEVFSTGTYSVDALGLASVSNPRLYKISIESPDEYLLLENRYNGADSNYENLSGRSSGLLITHIDEHYPAAQGMPDYTFYGVEAIVPGLDPLITRLEDYANYYGEMVFASDHGYTSLGPASPDDKAAGSYLTLTNDAADDTEHVIYRNTQGHTSSSGIDISSIGSSGQIMSFTATVSSTSPAISGLVKTPADVGIAGVTMTFSAGGGSTTTDADGHYVHTVSSGWSGTVTPAKTGYIFDPLSQSYSNVTNSEVDQDYFTATSFLKGNVTNSVGTAVEDVWVLVYSSAGGYLTNVYTDSSGDYVIGGLSTGDYKLLFNTRMASGMLAVEWYNDKDSLGAADLVSVTAGSTTSGIDAVLAEGGGIEGRVTNSAGAGILSVVAYAYTPTGGFVSYDHTDSNGDYEIKSVKSGSYKVRFYASADYVSEWYNDQDSLGNGNSISVTAGSTTSGIDAVLTAILPLISGTVKDSASTGIAGVIITFSNSGGTATTDSSGSYSLNVSDGYSGTATPAKAGYTFSPTSIDYTNVTSDQPAQYYTATMLTYTISGNVGIAVIAASGEVRAAAALSGVVMDGLPGDPTTDVSGNYTATADYGFSGTGTPTLAGYSFSPSSRDYTSVTSDQLDHNYTAAIIQHTLTIIAGSNGTTSPTAGTSTHDYGAQVQVTATPDSGYQFSSWTGDATGSTNPITITMDADKTITANFIVTPSDDHGDEDGDGGGGGCFIATAAYGSPLHPHLDILRDFRDKYLMPNGFGRKLVELYHRYSPGIASFIAGHKLLKAAVRVNLLPVIALSSLMVHFGPAATAIVLVFMLVFSILFIRFYPGRARIL